LVLLLVAMRRAGALRARRAASAEIRPALQAALVEFLAGGTDDSVFRRHIRSHAADIAESILLFQTTVGGSARDRLCGLALDLGLVQQWCEEGRSGDVIRRRALRQPRLRVRVRALPVGGGRLAAGSPEGRR